MTAFLQFAAVVALGAVVAWLVRQYLGFAGDTWAAAIAGFAVLLLIGFIVDRRSARARDKQDLR